MEKETIMIDGVRYYADRPRSCRGCYFWKNRKTGCVLKKENATDRKSILELKRNRAFTKAVSNMAIILRCRTECCGKRFRKILSDDRRGGCQKYPDYSPPFQRRMRERGRLLIPKGRDNLAGTFGRTGGLTRRDDYRFGRERKRSLDSVDPGHRGQQRLYPSDAGRLDRHESRRNTDRKHKLPDRFG